MAHLARPSPPLLVTKPLTSYLHDNLSGPLHTAALTTPSGRLLVHASRSSPARVLRRQCAVAASVWTLRAESRRTEAEDATPPAPSPASKTTTLCDTPVTVVLTGGVVVVILSLRCGILLVTIGGPQEHQGAAAQAAGPATPGVGALSARATELLQGQGNGTAAGGAGGATSPPLGSPSEAESVLSGGTGAASNLSRTASSAGGSSGGGSTAKTKLAVRRQTEELALLLDEKLGLLELPEESTGSSSDAR